MLQVYKVGFKNIKLIEGHGENGEDLLTPLG